MATDMATDKSNPLVLEIAKRLESFDQSDSPPRADMEVLRQELARSLGASVHSVPSSEYVYSNAVAIFYGPDGRPLEAETAQRAGPVFVVYVRASWILPYATVQWRVSAKPRESAPISDQQLPPPLREASKTIVPTLTKLGYEVLSGDILTQTVPGRLSELDGSPATVFEALFSATD
jgi:hypothetical protein